ncbi:MAG TPA: hypothetical protein VLA82_10240 [Actinomycetota bacterium]|nr:hypothetical protein [Actinomycetota bacterium]
MTPITWALEAVANPRSLRLHVAHELTTATIVTCPPAHAAPPFDDVIGLDAVRSIDLHRYRARFNLVPGPDRTSVAADAAGRLAAAWGEASVLPPDELPRAIAVDRRGERRVAESPEMAVGDPLLEAMFRVDGVAEAIAGDGIVLIRLGRFFRWDAVGPAIAAAARAA